MIFSVSDLVLLIMLKQHHDGFVMSSEDIVNEIQKYFLKDIKRSAIIAEIIKLASLKILHKKSVDYIRHHLRYLKKKTDLLFKEDLQQLHGRTMVYFINEEYFSHIQEMINNKIENVSSLVENINLYIKE